MSVDSDPCDVLVAVCTSNRAESLGVLLDSLIAMNQPECRWGVVVIDNPPSDASRIVAERAQSLLSPPASLDYMAVESQGLPNARNLALRAAIDRGSEALVFVDDDEYVEADWLENLWAEHLRRPSDVIVGPARTVLPEDAPEWIGRSGLADRPEPPTGTSMPHCPTNNTLIPTACLGSIWFDDRFAMTSGEDLDFFYRLVSQGGRISFCREAVVHEPWGLDRANSDYLRTRARRLGSLFARVTIEQRGIAGRLRVALSVLANVVEAVVLISAGAVKGDDALRERGAAKIAGLRGKLSSLIGATVPGKSDWSWG